MAEYRAGIFWGRAGFIDGKHDSSDQWDTQGFQSFGLGLRGVMTLDSQAQEPVQVRTVVAGMLD